MNHRKYVLVFIAIALTFLAVVFNAAHAYTVEALNNTKNINDTKMHLLYCTPPACPLEDRFYFDVPWRVNPAAQVYAYGIINWEYYTIKRVAIYDDINGNIIAERLFDDELSPNASQIPYTINFSIDTSNLSRINNRATIKMVFTTSLLGVEYNNTEGPINITVSEEYLPALNNWHYGDTHYHSSYTQNAVEFGGQLSATMNTIKAMGLDWITVTDHSFTLKTDEKWNAFRDECNRYPNCLISEEISCDNEGPLDYNHYLGYNITNRVYSGEYLDNGTSPLQCNDVVNQVNSQGGFGYAAHPFYKEGYYKDGFGLAYRNVWQDYDLPFTGMEIWNHEEAIEELEQGLVKWRELLLSGRKIFVEAGSDAHGDFNSALGKVRTACFARNFTKDNIFSALKSGNCMMTDGPIVVFTANKHIIGESFNVSEGDTVQLNISWNSTNEFGNVTEIFLIRGEINGTEINETILSPNNLSGNFAITSAPNNTYYRIEARSVDPEGKVRRAYTNPIWVYAEPLPEVEKIPMDEAELALVARFENKYDYSLDDLYFDSEPTLSCDVTELRKNLNLNDSWQSVKCEKMVLNGTRLMWAGFNNTETNETKIMLQIGNFLQYANATHNQFTQRWATCCSPGYGIYSNNNWAAAKNGKKIFDLNEVYNTNWAGDSYFGTYIVHGFRQYEGNTTVHYTHWGPDSIRTYMGAAKIYLNFDNAISYPIAYEGFYYDYASRGNFNRGIFHKRTYAYNASSFRFAADGQFKDGWEFQGDGTGYDSINRSIFQINQTNETINCHADIECNDGDLLTKDTCTNAGTTDSKCEYAPQEPEEVKKPFTEMDADEVLKAVDFKAKYNKTLAELYFDGWKNTTCNNNGILETLKLDKNWSVIQCQKFLINGTLAMFAGLNNTKTGEKYVAYQLKNVIIDETAEYKQIYEGQKIRYWTYSPIHYYQDFWSGWKGGKKRFEINSFSFVTCTHASCSSITPHGVYIIHGFTKDSNKNESLLYSYNKTKDADLINIWFDNYARFNIDGASGGNIYEIRTFNYAPIRDWAIGTDWFNYSIHKRSIFPPYPANELIAGLESPAHLRAQDSLNRITGYLNGTYVTEIPNSEILDTEHEKYLLPANESYRFFVEGYTDGNYSLKITRASGENSSVIYFKNISATNETQDIFELNGTGSIGIKTGDSEKNMVVALDGTEGSSENMEFIAAKNKSVSISVSNWGALNESAKIEEYINYAPEITSAYPENGSSFSRWQDIDIGFSATDQNNDSLEYHILYDGIELAQANETTYTLNEPGTHTINFRVSDGLNTVSEEIQINVIAPPKAIILSPENRIYSENNILLNAAFESAVNSAWISIDGGAFQNHTYNVQNLSFMLDALPEGAHSIRVYANNSAGAVNYSAAYFTISLPKSNEEKPRSYIPGFGGIVSNTAHQNSSANNNSTSAPEKTKEQTTENAPQSNLSGNGGAKMRENISEAPKTPTGFFISAVSSIAAKIQTALMGILHIFGI